MPVNAWTHIAVRLSHADLEATVFINGTGESHELPANFNPPPPEDDDEVRVGCSLAAKPETFRGLLDEVSFFSHAISDETLYHMALALIPEGAPAANADCSFDSTACAWNSEGWLRWHGAPKADIAGPLADHGSEAAREDNVPIICQANGHAYTLIGARNGRISFTEAQRQAKAMGGYLATIASQAEQDCVAKLGIDSAWLGASRMSSSPTSTVPWSSTPFKGDSAAADSFTWLDGTDTRGKLLREGYTNWRAGQPSYNSEQYRLLAIVSSGEWVACYDGCYVRGFIVESEHGSDVPAYKSNFHHTVDGWTSNNANLAVADCGIFGSALGPAGRLTSGDKVARSISGFPPHHGLRIELSVLVLGKWGSSDEVWATVDGKAVWVWFPLHEPSVWTDDSDNCGSDAYKQGTTATILVTDHTTSTVEIEVGSTFSNDGGGQSFALLGVSVYLEEYPSHGQCADGDSSIEACYMAASYNTEAPHTLRTNLLAPPAAPEDCMLTFWYNMRGLPSYSKKTCAQLNWPMAKDADSDRPWSVPDGYGNICASERPDEERYGGCHGHMRFSEAESICRGVGARLCTVDEILNNVGADPEHNCGSQDRLWTSTSCSDSGVLTAGGINGGLEPACTLRSSGYALLRCCADEELDKGLPALRVDVAEYGATPRIAWAVIGGGGGDWVNARVSLGLKRNDVPFTVTFEADHGNGEAVSGIVGLDDIAFEGCMPADEGDDGAIPDEVEIHVAVDDGKVIDAVADSHWQTKNGTLESSTAGALLFLAVQDAGHLAITSPSASAAKLNLGQHNFKLTALLSVSSDSEHKLVLDGGILDGLISFSPKGAIVSGLLFGQAETANMLPVPLANGAMARITVRRHAGTLSVEMQDILLHAASIGANAVLDHISLLSYAHATVRRLSVDIVLDEPSSAGGGAGGATAPIRVSDVTIATALDDATEELKTGNIVTDSNQLDLTTTLSTGKAVFTALRFTDIPVKRDDVITRAYVQFTAFEDSENAVDTLTVTAELSGDSLPFALSVLLKQPRVAVSQQKTYLLAASYSSKDACALLGFVYVGGLRMDSTATVTSLWEGGKVVTVAAPAPPRPYIDSLACSLSGDATNHELSKRPRVQMTTAWNPAPWRQGDRGEAQRTPDLAAVLNAVLKRGDGWAAGNALTIYIAGQTSSASSRRAVSFDGDATMAPTLHLEYRAAVEAQEAAVEAICNLPFVYSGRTYYACTTEANPRQNPGEHSAPWCGTEPVVTGVNDFGFCTSHVVRVFGGNAPEHAYCAFPFTFGGRTFLDCISTSAVAPDGEARTGEPWCATTTDYDDDGLWGYCLQPTSGGTAGGDTCVFPFYYQGQRYDGCTTDGGRGQAINGTAARAWCVTEETQPEDHALARWGYCDENADTVQTWSFACDCPAGLSGHRCDAPCSNNTWGVGCVHNCNCSSMAECEPVEGQCLCLAGWTGARCDIPPDSGRNDTERAVDCKQCRNEAETGTACSAAHPQCNCLPGWLPPYCSSACPMGYYGKRCTSTCKCSNSTCNPIDGSCDYCPPGTYGAHCDACPKFTFGEGCARRCQCGVDAHSCDAISGVCICGDDGEFCDDGSGDTTPDSELAFINEFFYGACEQKEPGVVELAGPAGMQLHGWQLEFYRGITGSPAGRSVGNFHLNGTLPDMQGGFGVIAFSPPASLMNNCDTPSGVGIALISAEHDVTQLLSIDGRFMAVDGAAKGVWSDQVASGPSAPDAKQHLSMQLQGTGARLGDFNWAATVLPATISRPNYKQTFSDSEAGVAVSLQVGYGVSDAKLKAFIASGAATRDLKDGVLKSLGRLGVSADEVRDFYVVQATGGFGLVAFFNLHGQALPQNDAVYTQLKNEDGYFVGSQALRVFKVTVGSPKCPSGTQLTYDNLCELVPPGSSVGDCKSAAYGCCPDGTTAASGPGGDGCIADAHAAQNTKTIAVVVSLLMIGVSGCMEAARDIWAGPHTGSQEKTCLVGYYCKLGYRLMLTSLCILFFAISLYYSLSAQSPVMWCIVVVLALIPVLVPCWCLRMRTVTLRVTSSWKTVLCQLLSNLLPLAATRKQAVNSMHLTLRTTIMMLTTPC